MTEITDNKIEEIAEAMVLRRMENTGETREQASDHIVNYLEKRK